MQETLNETLIGNEPIKNIECLTSKAQRAERFIRTFTDAGSLHKATVQGERVVGSILFGHCCAHFDVTPSSGTIPAPCVLPVTYGAFSIARFMFSMSPSAQTASVRAERTEK